MIFIIFILIFSTSKVDIFINYLELLEILMFIISIFFIRSLQPIFIICSLIIIALIYSYIIYNIIGDYWFRYIMIIVILSGVLVVFTYIISLIPNERFERYNLVVVVLFIIIFIGMYINKYVLSIRYICLDLWLSYVRIFNIFIVGFLLRVMLIVVWLRRVGSGAVRIRYLCAWIKG